MTAVLIYRYIIIIIVTDSGMRKCLTSAGCMILIENAVYLPAVYIYTSVYSGKLYSFVSVLTGAFYRTSIGKSLCVKSLSDVTTIGIIII